MYYPNTINYQASYEAEASDGGNVLITSEYTVNGVTTINKEISSKIQKLAELQSLAASLIFQKTDIEAKIQFISDLKSSIEAL